MAKTGEKPGEGMYQCPKCGEMVKLDDNAEVLPPCPRCHSTEFRNVG
jgi:ribosomal protein S27AE